MRILLNGACGRMGQAMRTMIANGKDVDLAGAVDEAAQEDGILTSLSLFKGEADCIVDFSHHTATNALCDFAVERSLPLLVATTGHTEDELARIHEAAKSVPVFCSWNMSLGIAVLARLVTTAVKMFPNADVEIVEAHHNRKLDVPSGTALMLFKAVQAARPDAMLLVGRHENGRRIGSEVGIHSLRMGNTVGIHEVIINTGTQILTLKHEAQDRALFAEGALTAAAFLMGKKPGFYNMEDLVNQ